MKKHVWTPLEVGFAEESFTEQLQEVIDRKSEKLPKYLQRCDRCWLLVVGLGASPSTFYEIGAGMTDKRYTSSFERVFFVHGFNGTVTELNVVLR